MGALVLDTSKVKANVIPRLDSAKNTVQEAYVESTNLRNVIPNSFSNRSLLNDIKNKIFVIRIEINEIIKKINENIQRIEKIEKKNSDVLSSITSLTNVIGSSVSNINSGIISSSSNLINSMLDFFERKSSVFSEFTDYQNVLSANLYLLCDQDIKLGENGKTINQIYKELLNNGKQSQAEQIKLNLIDNGFGNLTILEIIEGESSFDAVAIKDTDGNYGIYYACTDSTEMDDILFDAYKVYEFLINSDEQANDNIQKLLDTLSALGVISDDFNVDTLSNIYNSQVEQSKRLSQKYLNKAIEEEKTLNFFGYSLGGSLTEEAYLHCYQCCSQEQKNNNLGAITLYNPYHAANLDSSEIEILTQSGDLNLYCAEGDMVSSIFNFDDFKDYTNFVYIDTESIVEKQKEILNESDSKISSILNKIDLLQTLGLDISSIYSKDIESLKYIPGIWQGGAHSIQNVMPNSDIAFNSDGSLKEVITLSNGEEYIVDGMTFAESSELLFGYNIKPELKDFIFKLTNALESEQMQSIINLGQNYAEGDILGIALDLYNMFSE